MAEVRIQCCDICGHPLQSADGRDGAKRTYMRKEGLVIEIGYSRGGWGYRRDAVKFSGEVCGECFDTAETVLRAVRDFIRDRAGRPVDQAPLWQGQPSSEGRREPLRGVLRALSGRQGG